MALDGFDSTLLKEHLRMLTELVGRDRNHPSVIMWSGRVVRNPYQRYE